MDTVRIKLAKLKPAEYNPRTLSSQEREGLRVSLETFGQVENLVVNKDMTLISGHQRYSVMVELGWEEATCVVLDLNKRQEKKLNVTMNNQAVGGSWNMVQLSELLEELKLDDDYEALRLNKLEPVDLAGVDYTTLEEGKAPSNLDNPQNSNQGGVKSYTLIFDTTEDQEEFMDWLVSLKALYPEAETISERVIMAIHAL